MHKNDYKSAMQKLTPSEQWRADTLAKMQVAQAAAPTKQKVRAKQTMRARLSTRRGALALAAAVVLIAVPSLYLVLGSAGLRTIDKAAAPPTGAGFSSDIALDGAGADVAPREAVAVQDAANAVCGAPGEAGIESDSPACAPDEPKLASGNSPQTVMGVCTALTDATLTLQCGDGTVKTYALTDATQWPDGRALAGKALMLTLCEGAQGGADEVLCASIR